jgi:hypothetical protein
MTRPPVLACLLAAALVAGPGAASAGQASAAAADPDIPVSHHDRVQFKTNPAGSAIVNALGPIRQIVQNGTKAERRYLVIAEGTADRPARVVQTQIS